MKNALRRRRDDELAGAPDLSEEPVRPRWEAPAIESDFGRSAALDRGADGYRCEVTGFTDGAGRKLVLAAFEASSPRIAVHWALARLRAMSEQFDPQDGHWVRSLLSTQQEQEAAMAEMVFGQVFTLTVTVDGVVYVFSAAASTGAASRRPERPVLARR